MTAVIAVSTGIIAYKSFRIAQNSANTASVSVHMFAAKYLADSLSQRYINRAEQIDWFIEYADTVVEFEKRLTNHVKDTALCEEVMKDLFFLLPSSLRKPSKNTITLMYFGKALWSDEDSLKMEKAKLLATSLSTVYDRYGQLDHL